MSAGNQRVLPPGWPRPSGYSDGVLAAAGGRLLGVAGQLGWDSEQRMVSVEFAPQFEQALANVLAVVTAAGGDPEHLLQMRIYVLDRMEYEAARPRLTEVWNRLMGEHYPAMVLVQVAGLLEPEARVEIEATAVLPPV